MGGASFPEAPPQKTKSAHKFGAADHMVLIRQVKLNKIAAPAPYTHDQLLIRLGIFLRRPQRVRIHRIQLQLLEGQALTEENVELLAELDHLQWCRFRYLENWTQGEPENGRITDWEKRINRNLKPYQELDQRMKDSSRESVLKHFESENIVTAQ